MMTNILKDGPSLRLPSPNHDPNLQNRPATGVSPCPLAPELFIWLETGRMPLLAGAFRLHARRRAKKS